MPVLESQPPPKIEKITFSEELTDLAGHFGDRAVTVGESLAATQGRGYNLLLVLVALPFLTPIPLPGFSIPFGVAAALIGSRLALGKQPWLPERFLARPLPPKFLPVLIRAASRVMRWMEYVLRSRLTWVYENSLLRRASGVGIALSGLFLMLPFPIPFSNALPASTVLLFAAGTLERDGLFFFAGCLSLVLTTSFFAALAYGGVEGLQFVQQWFRV